MDNYSTGYWAKEVGSKGRQNSSVHVHKNGEALCGYKPAESMLYQFCTYDISLRYCECDICKNRATKILIDNTKK